MPEPALSQDVPRPKATLAGARLELPPPWPADLVEVHRVGGVLYTPGVIPRWGAEVSCRGAVGTDVPVPAAAGAARLCALNLASLARATLGSLDHVTQVLQLNILVRCGENFERISAVADGASEAMGEIFGAAGRHRRSVLATANLPGGVPVQVSAIIRVA